MLSLSVFLLGGLLGIGLMQLVVDPYGVWGTPWLDCCTTHKLVQADTERLFKPYRIARRPARVVWLGSSRVHSGFEASWPGYDNNDVYNMALDGLHVPELTRVVDFLLARPETTPEVVVLGVDLFMVSRRARAPRRGFSQLRLDTLATAPGWWLQVEETVLAMEAVKASIRTLAAGPGEPVSVRGHHRSPHLQTWEAALELEHTTTYAGFDLSQHDLRALLATIRRLRDNGVEVVVFVPPIHQDQLDLIALHGLRPHLDSFRSALSETGPVVDFTLDAQLTSDRSAFSDPGHLLPEVGRRLTAQLAAR